MCLPAAVPALAPVGVIQIPDTVLAHRFVVEIEAVVHVVTNSDEVGSPVAGTSNTKACELYGWGPDVAPHADRTGFVYLVCLNDGDSTLHALHDGEHTSVTLRRGEVVRLWDGAEHWTQDETARVAAFVGSFKEPQDAEALAVLTAGVGALGRGDYYGAPRCSPGFVVPRKDECYVANWEASTYEHMLLSDAKAQGRHIIECACCGAPAIRVDGHWPYFWDGNKCGTCLGGT